jgi:hypothetical protein
MKKLFVITAATLLLFSLLLTGCAQYSTSVKDNITIKDSLALHGSCIMTGRVVDGKTSSPIRGANVVIFSKPISAVTDLYGQFDIIDIQPGTYTLQVFCVGYIQKDIPDIIAKPDRFMKLELRLEPRPDYGK